MTEKISTNSKFTAKDFNFFPPRSLRLMGALGKTTPHAQNNTFASPNTHVNASACKRVVFLPSHRYIFLPCVFPEKLI